MQKNLKTLVMVSLLALTACDKTSKELIPCMCDSNAESTLGIFDCMCEPAKKKPVRRISYLQDKQKVKYQTLIINDEQQEAYALLHHSRGSFAPIKLENVDFRIRKNQKYDQFNSKLGDYRFRIFGCRRETKNAFLNQGRTMQKDMRFFDVFYETLNDYYPVVVDPANPYYADSDKYKHPEYLITAEITDYFMNICDEFDWNETKAKKLRAGTSEMTVVWRVMDLAKERIYCKGVTTGYGQVEEGEPNGENLLVERAFEDALVKLPEISCFNNTISQRVCEEDIAEQLGRRNELENCDDCFNSQYQRELEAIELLQECQPEEQALNMTVINSNGGVNSTGLSIEGKSQVECDGGIEECNNVVEEIPVMETTGGAKGSNYNMSENCQQLDILDDNTKITTNQKISLGDDFFVDIPLEIDGKSAGVVAEDGGVKGTCSSVEISEVGEDSFAEVNSRFCIINNPPFENMKPHNLYKLRASVVTVENKTGLKGAGLIIADNMVLTSADLISKENNVYNIETVNGKKFKASAFRVNPVKNVAVLLLDAPTKYTPLPLSLELPEVNKDVLMTIGLLDFDNEGENYIDNQGRVVGYRWSENRDVEIIVDTFVQTVSLGSVLVDANGNVIGIAHEIRKTENSPDFFIPIDIALRSLGLEICGQGKAVRSMAQPVANNNEPLVKEQGGFEPRPKVEEKPKEVRIYTPLADAIDNSKADKAPVPMSENKRK